MKFRISTADPSARVQWVASVCQSWLGSAASNRISQERGAQADDLLGNLGRDRRRRAVRPPRARLQPGLTLAAIPGQELVQPAAVHPVHSGEFADRPTLAQMC